VTTVCYRILESECVVICVENTHFPISDIHITICNENSKSVQFSHMKKYKNVLLSLGSYVIAFVWYFFWLSPFSILLAKFIPPTMAPLMNKLIIIFYFIFILIGIFLGWKSIKSKESILFGNLIFLIGIIILFASGLFYVWLSAWSV